MLLLDVALLIALGLMSWAFANSRLLQEQPQLVGYAILLDLTLSAALCHWLIGVRLGGAPAWTLLPLVALGLALGRLLLPAEVASTGTLPLVALGLVEAAALGLAVARLRAIRRAYAAARRSGAEAFDALEMGVLALAPHLPGVAAWVRLELQLWTLALLGWFFEPAPKDAPHVFTHHRESGWFGLVGVVCFLLLLEGGLVHWWLHASGYTAAKWALFALHVYTFVWLIGDAQALRIYRSSIRRRGDQWVLSLSVGLRHRARISLADVAEVTVGAWDEPGEDELLAVVQGAANVRLALRTSVSVRPTLGAAKSARSLLLQVDEPEAFRVAVSSLLAT